MNDKIKKIVISAASVLLCALCSLANFIPSAFNGVFGPHRLKAASAIELAQFSGVINIRNNGGGIGKQIVSFSADTTPMKDAYFINNSLTGSAIRNANNSDVPYMPPSANDTSSWYVYVDGINQNAAQDYRIYTANQDLYGDIVYFPGTTGMTVAGNDDMNFADNDFKIEIDGMFNGNNHSNNDIIFSNDNFYLTYKDGLLSFNSLEAAGAFQTITAVTFPINYTTENVGTTGKTLSLTDSNNGTAYLTLVVVPDQATVTRSQSAVNPTTITRTTSVSSRYTTTSYKTSSWTTTSSNTVKYYLATTTYYDTVYDIDLQTIKTLMNETDYTTFSTIVNDVITARMYNGNSTVITGNGTKTITMTGAGDNFHAITVVGSNGITTATSRRTLNSGTSTQSTVVPGTSETVQTSYVYEPWEDAGNNTTLVHEKGWRYLIQTTITNLTYNSNPTRYTTYTINTQGAGDVAVQGTDIAYGLEYVYLNDTSVTAAWGGGDTTLVVERKNNAIKIYDKYSPNDTIINVTVADDQPVLTSDINSWTFCENGAMPYMRSLQVYKDTTNTGSFDDNTLVGSYKWNTGNTFTDLSGHENVATPSFITTATTNQLITTLGDYEAITGNTTTTTSERGGLVDTSTPDSTVNEETHPEKWKDIVLFGLFADFAEAGGIPLSLFFVPLISGLAIFVHFMVYKFTRDMLISGIAGCAILGCGIALSILYTFPLVLAIIMMFVLLVKRKTISM